MNDLHKNICLLLLHLPGGNIKIFGTLTELRLYSQLTGLKFRSLHITYIDACSKSNLIEQLNDALIGHKAGSMRSL